MHEVVVFSFLDDDGESMIKPYNYFKIVSENKEIVRIFMSLQGVMYLVNPDILNLLEVSNFYKS